MESPSPEKMKCPSPETLSAVFDHECDEDTVLRHVRECEACRTHLEELERLDRVLKLALEQETPADISERILAGIRNRGEAHDRKFNSHSRTLVLARVAALFAVLGVVSYMIWDDTSSSAASSNAPVHMPPRVAQSAGANAELGAADTVNPAFRRLGTVDVADLDAASFSNTPATVYPIGSDPANCPAQIPNEVRQVWSVPARATDFRQSVMSLIHTLGIPSNAVQFKQDGGQFSVRFHGTKMQAVKFVKTCKALGYSLLSPVQPQPEQNRFAGSADAAIQYDANFVSR